MTASAVAAHALASTGPDDETFVLHGRQLRPGTSMEDTARFGDDVWPVSPAVLQQHHPAVTLNFTMLPGRYRPVAKELFYAMLSGALPPGEDRPAIGTLRTSIQEVRRFFTWLDRQARMRARPLAALAEHTGADLDGYRRHVVLTLAPAYQRLALATVRYFWRYRQVLTSDKLSFDPLSTVDGWSMSCARRAENSTQRIPEQVLGPLLAWSMRFVDDFAPDILAAHRLWVAARPPGKITLSTSEGRAAVRRLLDDHLARRRPLPGRGGQLNMKFLADVTGCPRRQLYHYQEELAEVASVVGICDRSQFDVPMTALLDGRPWTEAITTDHVDHDGLATVARMLQASCYVVIAFLSGMRDSETKHLSRGCLRAEHDEDGEPYRWRATSLAFKGEDDPAGVEATWVVGQPVARAIAVLEQLHAPGQELLFTPLPHSPGGHKGKTSVNTVLQSKTTNDQLNELCRWINDCCTRLDRGDNIPDVNCRPWRLSTRQFRRTLAWFISRRPGGAIAGAVQYRHLSIQMFEGYAGTSESGFRSEVESEQALARGEHLLALIDAHEHHGWAGPAATEAAERLEHFSARSGFHGTVITDSRRLLRLMKRSDPAVYPGTYATCVFNPDRALCTKQGDSSGSLQPALHSCQPLECRNVALTTDNIGALTAELGRIDRELDRRPGLPPLLHHRLSIRRDQITVFLGRHTPEHR